MPPKITQDISSIPYQRKSNEPPSLTTNELLQWSILNSATKSEDAPERENEVKPEKIDTKWLDVILGKGDSVVMRECCETIQDEKKSLDEKLNALDEMEMLVEQIDNANNLKPLKLWEPLLNVFTSTEEPEIKMYLAWIFGTSIQNNPTAQKDFMDNGVLQPVLSSLVNDKDTSVLKKIIYCLSGFLKHNPAGIAAFEKLNGYQKLVDTFEQRKEDPIIQSRILWLLRGLLMEESEKQLNVSQYLVKTTIFESVIDVLTTEAFNGELFEKAIQFLKIYIVIIPKVKSEKCYSKLSDKKLYTQITKLAKENDAAFIIDELDALKKTL